MNNGLISLPVWGLLALLWPMCHAHAQFAADESGLQTSCGFAHYLFAERDHVRAATEFERCHAEALLLGQEGDTLLYLAGLAYRLAGDPQRSNQALRRMHNRSGPLWARARIMESLNEFDRGRYGQSLQAVEADWFGEGIPDDLQAMARRIRAINLSLLNEQESLQVQMEALPSQEALLLKELNAGYNLERGKSPWVAGALSMAVPGLGKAYAGRPLDGLYSLMMVGLSSWQAYSGYRDDGFDSPRFYIYGAVALYFYTGNVYGSAAAARIHNQNRRDGHQRALQNLMYREW